MRACVPVDAICMIGFSGLVGNGKTSRDLVGAEVAPEALFRGLLMLEYRTE